MNLFADSSALAKRYIADEKSGRFDELLQRTDGLAVSVLCLPEIISALCRRRRERLLNDSQYKAAKRALEADLADAAVIAMTDEVLLGGIDLLESNSLRASDAMQISSALVWGADVFASADARQCTAAKGAGLDVIRL
ncbi:MAG TPA: type II toxin-antitoxin system VapC family toxin [Terriglobia bacterium]